MGSDENQYFRISELPIIAYILMFAAILHNCFNMRKTAFFIFILIPLFGLTQGEEFYQLKYKDKPNYTETNHFLTDSIWRFQQTVAYDEANTFDEQIWTKLEIEIKDTTAFLQKRILDFSNDSSVAKYYFTISNAWHSNRFNLDTFSITGQVQLLSITHEGISLKLNLTVTSLKTQNQFIYTGERMFYKFDPRRSLKELLDKFLTADSTDVGTLMFAGINSFSDKNPDLRTAIKYFEKALPLLKETQAQFYSANWYIGRSYQILLQSDGLTYNEVSRMLDCYSTYLRLQPKADDAAKISSYIQHIKEIRPPDNVKKWIYKPQ